MRYAGRLLFAALALSLGAAYYLVKNRLSPQVLDDRPLSSHAKEQETLDHMLLQDTPAAPMAAQEPVNNEVLHSFLEKEKKRLGIKLIIPPSQSRLSEPPGDEEPMGENERRDHLRSMAKDIAKVVQASKTPPVAISEHSRPALISASSDKSAGEPVEEKKPGARKLDAQKLELHDELITAVVRSEAELNELAARVGGTRFPPIDFSKDMLVAVYPSPGHYASGAEIVSAHISGGRLLISYRQNASSSARPGAAPFKIMPRMDLPAEFEKTR